MSRETDGHEHLHFYLKELNLTRDDKEILESIKPIVTAVATVFGRNCEVILHSLEDPGHSVIKIENGHITGRKEGSPLTDLAMKTLIKASEDDSDVVGSYFTRTKDNKLFKSVTALIKNPGGKVIGMLCINIDISAGFGEFIKDFIPEYPEEKNGSGEHFFSDLQDMVDATLSKAMQDINARKGISIREKNLQIITELYNQNIFDIKGSVDIVAEQMGLSKYTIYSYLRTLKE